MIPGGIDEVGDGNFGKALDIINRGLPLPEVLLLSTDECIIHGQGVKLLFFFSFLLPDHYLVVIVEEILLHNLFHLLLICHLLYSFMKSFSHVRDVP